MASLRERRILRSSCVLALPPPPKGTQNSRFAYAALPTLGGAEALGEASSFDISAWTPMCQRTPQGNVELISGKKRPGAVRRVQSLAELDLSKDQSEWERSECLSVTEQDLQRCGGDVSLLRQCAERRKKIQESFTPWQTPMSNAAAGRSLGKKPQMPALPSSPASGFQEEFKRQLAVGLDDLQKNKQGGKLWQSSYRLPGVYTVLQELSDDLPPRLPPKKNSQQQKASSLPSCPMMKSSGSHSSQTTHSRPPSSRSGKSDDVETIKGSSCGRGRKGSLVSCSSLPTLLLQA